MMNELENRSKKRRRRQNIQKIVLGTLKGTSVIAFALMAPNALSVLEQIDPSFKKRKKNPKYTVNSSISRLLEKGFISFEQTSKGKFVRLTKRGEAYLESLNIDKIYQYQKKRRWDRRWRIIIFDIPESKRGIRDRLRLKLQEIGFLRLQHSVWVYPYDCEGLMTMIKAELRIGKDILYIIADQIENDKIIRAHFSLK